MFRSVVKFFYDLLGREYLRVEFGITSEGEGVISIDYNRAFVVRVRENFGFQGTEAQVVDQFITTVYLETSDDDVAYDDDGDFDEEVPNFENVLHR